MIVVRGRLSYFNIDGSLTFPSNQLYYMYYLANTLTLSSVMLWCSCAHCSPTAMSGSLSLICYFIIGASVLSVSPMYVRGIQGTTPGNPDNISGRRVFALRMYQDGSNCVDGPMVGANPCALNTRVCTSVVPRMYGKPTIAVGLVHVDVVLCYCLGLRTLNIHCL